MLKFAKFKAITENVTTTPDLRKQPLLNYHAEALQQLIENAAEDGVVLTIELEPVAPLAMGHYVMRGHVRGAR